MIERARERVGRGRSIGRRGLYLLRGVAGMV